MSKKVIIKSNMKDLIRFAKIIPTRKGQFDNTPATPLPAAYSVNETAKHLHPFQQELTVKEVIEHSSDVKSYILVSATGEPLAYFRAGQYLSVRLTIGGSVTTRPFSIASTPADALNGEYMITVKRVADGFASGYILDHWAAGSAVKVSAPEGNFYYEALRDASTVVGIAGGSGITPFLSLAGAIADGTEDAELVLFYGCRTKKDIIFEEKLASIQARCAKVKVIYVLSDSDEEGYEHGFISAELIKKYAPSVYSVFVCGPGEMYQFVADELEKLRLEKKYIRFELFEANTIDVGKPETFCCRVTVSSLETKVISCRSNESVLVALERAGISAPSRCRSGECGFCRCRLVSGEVFIPPETDGRRKADLKFGYLHPCCSYPKSDIKIKL